MRSDDDGEQYDSAAPYGDGYSGNGLGNNGYQTPMQERGDGCTPGCNARGDGWGEGAESGDGP